MKSPSKSAESARDRVCAFVAVWFWVLALQYTFPSYIYVRGRFIVVQEEREKGPRAARPWAGANRGPDPEDPGDPEPTSPTSTDSTTDQPRMTRSPSDLRPELTEDQRRGGGRGARRARPLTLLLRRAPAECESAPLTQATSHKHNNTLVGGGSRAVCLESPRGRGRFTAGSRESLRTAVGGAR